MANPFGAEAELDHDAQLAIVIADMAEAAKGWSIDEFASRTVSLLIHDKGNLNAYKRTIELVLQVHAAALAPAVALQDVAAERKRQVEGEGWTLEHDDQHSLREMAGAAAAYCHSARRPKIYARSAGGAYAVPPGWPPTWSEQWWKPRGARPDLVRAGALILAEIERLDRVTAAEKAQ